MSLMSLVRPLITWCDIPPSLPLFTVHTLYKQLLYKIIRTAKSLPNYGYWTKKRVPMLFSRPIFNTTFSIQKWIFNARIISKLEDKKVKNYFDQRASQEKINSHLFLFHFLPCTYLTTFFIDKWFKARNITVMPHCWCYKYTQAIDSN